MAVMTQTPATRLPGPPELLPGCPDAIVGLQTDSGSALRERTWRYAHARGAQPGETFTIAVFGINGPISVSPRNYIWMRTATLDFYARERARVGESVEFELERTSPGLDQVVAEDASLERVAGGFEFTEGPVWSPEGALLFSSPNTNAIYRWTPDGKVDVFRSKSGYTGTDIGR